MAASLTVSLQKCFLFPEKCRYLTPVMYIQERFASRKGKRAKLQAQQKELKARKLEEMTKRGGGKVPGFLKMSKSNINAELLSRRRDVSMWLKSPPLDDVWFDKFFKKQAIEVEKAIEYHRESHHPTVYNKPNAMLYATIELNLTTPKKTKFIPKFKGTICYPNRFEFGTEKRVLAISKSTEEQEKAIEAGATQAGGINIIKGFQSGEITLTNLDHIVAHSDILMELASIRGILKNHFPNKQKGNFGNDMAMLVDKFKNGVEYSMNKDSYDEAFGWVDIVIGQLDMPLEQIMENLIYMLKTIDTFANTKVQNPFINDVILWSPPSLEKFYTQFWKLLPKYYDEKVLKKYTIIGSNNYAINLDELFGSSENATEKSLEKPDVELSLKKPDVEISVEKPKVEVSVENPQKEVPFERRKEPDFFRYIP